MKKIILALLLPLACFGQNQVLIDSLEKQLPQARPDTNRVLMLNALAFEYRAHDAERAKSLLDESLKLTNKLDYRYGEAMVYNHLALISRYAKKFDESVAFNLKSMKIKQAINDQKGVASSYNNLGNIYNELRKYDSAIYYFLQSLRIREQFNDKTGMSASLNNIGMVYSRMNEVEKAINYCSRALKLRMETGDSFETAKMCTQLAYYYYMQNKYADSRHYYYRALSIFNSVQDLMNSASVETTLGNICVETGEYEKGIAFLSSALEKEKMLKNSNGIVACYISLAQALGDKKDFNTALAYLDKALTLIREENMTIKAYADVYDVQSELYRKSGQGEKAYWAFRKSVAYTDTIRQQQRTEVIEELQVQYETEKKDLEIRNTALELGRKKMQLYVLIAALAGLLVLALLIYNRYKLKQRSLLDAERLSQQELRNKAIIEAEEKERIRIAKDLHDGVGQQLSALKMNMSVFESDAATLSDEKNTKYQGLISMLDESIKELRAVSHNMMPNALIRAGLASAIRDFINKIASSGLLKIDLQIIGLDERLENTTETVLYRVLQEVVSNIIKHAKATDISIQLIRHNKYLNIMIEDNGVGFDTTKINDFHGIGLKNIMSRISFLNGEVHFDSSPGRGTSISINIPLSA